MEIINFQNLESSKLASDMVLNPIRRVTEGAFAWQNLKPHLSLTVAKQDSKSSADIFAVKLILRLPDGRCFDCEKKAETLACAADSLSLALRNFLNR
jgi:hypothetical protein